MYNNQYVYGWEDIDNKLHQIKINLYYSIWNHPSKVHQWKERQHNKDMSIYIIDMKIANGCWISIPQVQRKFIHSRKELQIVYANIFFHCDVQCCSTKYISWYALRKAFFAS